MTRTRQQARLASVAFVIAAIVLATLNLLFIPGRSLLERSPDLIAVLALIACGVLVRQRWPRGAAIPWLCAGAALLLVEMMVIQTWWNPTDLGTGYALVIMAVYGAFVLNFPAMLTVAVPMFASYLLTVHHVAAEGHLDAELTTDFALLALTALGVGGVVMGLRLAGFDSLSDAMAASDAMATNDPLTGLLNRRAFHERATQLVADADRHNEQVVALFVDVDHMKAINDGHGHATGDQVLTLVATAMQQAVRGSDLVCRWGGDEFVALGISNDPAGFAELVRHAVTCEAHHLPQWNGQVTIGCAVENSHRLDWQSIVARADADMYGQRERARANTGSSKGEDHRRQN